MSDENIEQAIIIAIDSKNGFAKDGKIPWHYSEDFKHFRELTIGHICVMGKNTYLDINERLGEKAYPNVLPNRTSIVLSSTLKSYKAQNVVIFKSLDDLDNCLFRESRTVFYIGGQSIFDAALKSVDTLYITHIKQDFECDQFFDMNYVIENFSIDEFAFGDNQDLMFYKYVRNK
jgi:dihydrofolate reductase